MVEMNLEALLAKRERSLLSLANETGLNYNTLHRLQKGKAQGVTYNTLNALCEALNCLPGDLLVYVPEKKGKGAK